MLKWYGAWLTLGLLTAALNGCAWRTPSSAFDGTYSTTTAQHMLPGYGANTYKGYPDDKVLRYERDAACQHRTLPPRKADQPLIMPGIVPVSGTGFGIDEAEIPNQEWQQFQAQVGRGAAQMQPSAAALPVPGYYTDPFYRYYPVVGISREQAEAFCRWRSRLVTRLVNKGLHQTDSLAPGYLRCEYRLPTEAEWEQAAAAGTCGSLPLQVAPQAAVYLQKRSGSQASPMQIAADIRAYNKTRPTRNVIQCDQPEPYFLRLATPGYVYQMPANTTGLYHLLGNAAELVQEPGITKGGSYRDPLTACTVKARGSYTGPAPTIGFRCVCVVSYPNRK